MALSTKTPARQATDSPSPRPGSLLSELTNGKSLSLASTKAPGASLSKDLFAVQKRKSWDKSVEARCDFAWKPRLVPRAGVWFISLWQKSVKGRTLTEIKQDEAEIAHFAEAISEMIIDLLGRNLAQADWAIITTPKRRHKVHNFASLICIEIHKRLQIPFIEDVAICKSKERINAVFELNAMPPQTNLIVFDDFVTTGSTLKSMDQLLKPLNKNLLFIAGINNKL
ncbi:MAG: hypothetical protein K2M07_08310 [Muribaculaceae bacterium]|nr:hypothetical protein [Muribaculaceae bacterium]